jgi:predicted Na+-dependent transporter
MAKKPKNVARKHRNWQRWLKLTLILVFGFIIFNLAINLAIRLPINQEKPVDAILVLGGSIRREIYVANLAQQYPDIPSVLILPSAIFSLPCQF